MSSPTLEAPLAAPTLAATPPPVGDDDVVLSVQGVSKHYKLWTSPSVRLRYSMLSQAHRTLRTVLPRESAPLQALRRRRDALHQDFTALEELSFEVRRGESLGILGRNGAGKSTLLQIIAGTLRPSTGHVEVRGRVAALLELGSGFNMEYTGRENVYLNASLLGFSKAEVDEKFDDIAAFADIGQFLDQPVKTYSSGMLVRLAFAVQMAVEPELFIIDEALAVGDIYFQNKCNKLLKQKLADGLTLLLVSHDPASVRSLCARALVLDHGRMEFLGPSDEGTTVYHAIHSGALIGKGLASIAARSDAATAAPSEAAPLATEIGPEDTTSSEHALERAVAAVPDGIGAFQDEIGDGTLTLTGCVLFDQAGHPAATFVAGESIRIGIAFVPKRDFPAGHLIAGFQVRDRFNTVAAASTSLNCGIEMPAVHGGQRYVMLLGLHGRLGSGKYLLDFGLGCDPDHADSPLHHHHRYGGIAAFEVHWFGRRVTFQGICDVGARFSPVQAASAR